MIRDFDRFSGAGDISDRIQLLGSAANYSLSNVVVGGITGAGISFGNDLIGIVQNFSAANLNLMNSNQFTYIT